MVLNFAKNLSVTICNICCQRWSFEMSLKPLSPNAQIFGLQYRDFTLSEVKYVLVKSFGIKIFVLIMEVFSIESRAY